LIPEAIHMDKRPALGKGLSALIPDVPDPRASPAEVDIDRLSPNAFQPRGHVDDERLDDLARSIKANGIIQPIVVRRVGDRFQIIAGERRWRAAQRVGLHEVPVVVRRLGDSDALEIALVENLQREDLSSLEEAEAYSRLTREFGRSQAGLAEAVGKSRSHVANTLRLLGLPAPVRKSLEEGALSAGHARALLGASDPAALAVEVMRRGLNVRATETLVRRRAAGLGVCRTFDRPRRARSRRPARSRGRGR
jgi:ParB family chromosome partitioning protein